MPTRVAVPLAVMYVDHNVLQIDDKNMQDHRYLRVVLAALRAAVLPARARDLALRAPGAVRPAGRAAARRGLAQHDGRRARACSRPARAGWRSPWRWPATASTCPARGWSGSSSPARLRRRGRGQGRDPRAAAPPRRARRARRGVRVLRRRRGHHPHQRAGPRSATWSSRPGPPPGSSPPTRRPGAGSRPRTAADDFIPLAADPGAAYDEVERIDLSAAGAAGRAAAVAGQRGAGRRGRRHRGGAGVRRVVGEQLVRGPGHRGRDAARAEAWRPAWCSR